MKMSIYGKQLTITPAIKEYAESKIGKMTTFSDNILEITATLSASKLKSGDFHTAEVLVYLDGATIKATASSNDLYTAIDLVVDKLERQLKKHKDKINDAIRSREHITKTMKVDIENNVISKADAKIVTVYMPPKPMSLEEAILQLEMTNKKFLAFTNDETNKMNIVYRRKDGDYGHIVPR